MPCLCRLLEGLIESVPTSVVIVAVAGPELPFTGSAAVDTGQLCGPSSDECEKNDSPKGCTGFGSSKGWRGEDSTLGGSADILWGIRSFSRFITKGH